MTVNLDVFSAFVEDRISSNIDGGLTVTMKRNRVVDWNMKIGEKLAEPLQFTKGLAMDRYSASADDRDTLCCFLAFQEIGDKPNKMK